VPARNRVLTDALEGQRAFVLATGPSTAQLDLQWLCGETVRQRELRPAVAPRGEAVGHRGD
jgi:hypothetical protein